MKRCPQCNLLFPDAEHFCEADGTQLVIVDEPPPNPLPVTPHPKSNQMLLPIGVLLGFLVGILFFLVYFVMSRQTTQENLNTTSSSSSTQQQVIDPRRPALPATDSPSVEPSVEPSPSPSVEAPPPQTSPAQVVSSSNPISTAATGNSNPVIIKLVSGLTIEADEAWQTGEGIWYRKHGVVSLLDPKNVKAIEKVLPAAPQPSVSPSP